jgi:hypothetical protein
MKTSELKTALRNGPYAWPGGYPLYFVTSDGAALSFEAVRSEYRQVIRETRDYDRGEKYPMQWAVIEVQVNWEDPDLYCEYTGKRIESAYADGEAA